MRLIILFCIIILNITNYVNAQNYLVWGTTRGDGVGTTNSGTAFDCSGNAGGFGTVSRDLWSVNSSTGVSTNIASFDTGNCVGLSDSGIEFNNGSYVDKNTGNFYALQSDNTFKVYNGTTGALITTTAVPSISNATITGLSHTGTSHIIDTSGNKIIEKKSDGSLHIGENSLVTKEENGRQSLYALDGSSNKIDIDVNNGSDLLVNGTSVMGSIKSTTALGVAFSSINLSENKDEFSCGLGLGHYSSRNALAASCGKYINDDWTVSGGASHLINNSDNLGDLPEYALKLGFTYNFGKAKKRKVEKTEHNYEDINLQKIKLLENEINILKKRLEEINNLEFEIAKLNTILTNNKLLPKTISY